MGCETLRVQSIPPGRSGPTPPKRRGAVQFRGGVPSRSRLTAGAVPGLSHPASGSIPAASTILWKVRSAWCRHRSRKPGGARASGFDSCTFRSWPHDPHWKTISRWRERRLLNGWTLTGCGSTPPASAHRSCPRFTFSHAPSQRAYTPRRFTPAPASYAGPAKAFAPAALERAPFRFRAPRRRSPTRKHLVRLQIGPPHGPSADGRHFPVKETSLRLRHSGARAFLACPAEQSPHAPG